MVKRNDKMSGRKDPVRGIGISLAPRYLIWTIAVNAVILGAFLSVYYITNSNPANITLASVYAAHVVIIWVFFIVTVSNPRYFTGQVTGIRLLFLFLFTVVKYMVIYATLITEDPTAFAGLPPILTKSSVLGNSLFLAVVSIASLGTGAIIPVSGPARLFVALNAIASIAYFSFAAIRVMSLLRDYENVQRTKSRINRLL